MNSFGALILAAAALAGGEREGGHGAEVLSARVQAEIVRPAIVRQVSGFEQGKDMPVAQITRSGRTILVEFQ
jgi:hypothetical protein